MSRKKKIRHAEPPEIKIGGKRISRKAFEAEEEGSTDHLPPVFSFAETCPNHFQLYKWTSEELKHLIDALRRYSKMRWQEIRKTKGFNSVDPSTFSVPLPNYISPDVAILEFRVNHKARIFGYRSRQVFNIIWFDRNHEVYPMS
ncbi:Putative uncharacterized protein [Thermobacillus xylanilyticus]|uniref:Uncharacterized protein n=1 Tax=Thermobacillus xylanilyticus TaxID=76633 RepID=A0ABM8V6M9_THEXY|nr:hypothetical protein [Thermobacillus xylanilyticus]CAG5089470.1 Putative uncharacterized protein [Thermobacillus xylanilyticus]